MSEGKKDTMIYNTLRWIVSRVHLHPYDAYRSLPVESMSCLRDRDDIY